MLSFYNPSYLSNNSPEGDGTSMRVMSGTTWDVMFCLVLHGFAGHKSHAPVIFFNHVQGSIRGFLLHARYIMVKKPSDRLATELLHSCKSVASLVSNAYIKPKEQIPHHCDTRGILSWV